MISNISRLHQQNQNEQSIVTRRKELIKREYNKIVENKLPNILFLMNSEKQNQTKSNAKILDLSLNDSNQFNQHHLEYDDTELLSKLFNKDYNKSGVLDIKEIQLSLQQKNDKSRYQKKSNTKNTKSDHEKRDLSNLRSNYNIQRGISQSSSQEGVKGRMSEINERHDRISQKLHQNQKQSQSKVMIKRIGLTSKTPDQDLAICQQTSESLFNIKSKDKEVIEIDRLQFINASARYDLLSANQQLLDFHLSRLMTRKHRNKKKVLQETSKRADNALNPIHESIQQNMIVCEDYENESDNVSDLNRMYDQSEIKKRDKVKQMPQLHQIIRLNSMNPLCFGDTMRLPELNNYNSKDQSQIISN
eukprot:403333352